MFANKSKKIQKRMKRNYCLLLVLFAVLEGVIPGAVSATSYSDVLNPQETLQTRRITGTVVDSKGDPIIGASVLVKGTNVGVITDVNGDFTLSASQGSIFTISYVGYTPQEAFIGTASSYRIVLIDDALALSEVVVTAMGIKKEKKALGYSVQDIKSDELLKNKSSNIINSLNGKIAGVNVTQSGGGAGSGASIIIRGGTSLERDNQPLFVVDGIVYDNGTNIGGDSGFDGAQSTNSTYSNRVMDINPEDVESMSVLKGPAAAALYGSRAAPGVIIITTKRGQEGQVGVSVNSKLSTSWANRLPEQQQIYKRGTFGNTGVFTDVGVLSSWGEKYGSGDERFNNIDNFFKNALTWDNNVSVSGGTKNSNYFLSVSRYDQEGIIPETNYVKNTFRFNGEQKYGKFTAGANVAYSVADAGKSLTSGGLYQSGGTGAMVSVYRWPGNEDMRHWRNDDGSKYRLFPDQMLADDIDNPYWIVNKDKINDKTTRLTGNVRLNLDLFDWWKITYNAGTDRYTTNTRRLIEPDSGVKLLWQKGMLSESDHTYEYLTSNVMMNFNKKITDFDLNLLVGNSVEDTKNISNRRMGWNFVVDNFFSINNTADADRKISQTGNRKRLVGVYGEFRAGYKSIAYATFTGRNDWTSTLPIDNRSYFYPSVGGAFVFSELIPANDILSFGKIRASWARVGKDADPYVTNTYLEVPELSINGSALRNGWTQGNPYLIPETTESTELGLEMRFLKGRLGFDFTYYTNKSYNQLLSPRTSQAGGYIFMTTNAADITNKGMEFSLTGIPVKIRNFTWESTLNLSGNRGKVNNLLPGLEILYVTDVQVGNAKAASFNGNDFMAISGSEWARDPDGNVILNAKTGMPTSDNSTEHYIGNREPKLLGGLNNTLTYKNWSLSFLLDFRVGGDIYNGTDYFMTEQGVSVRSANRDNLTINGVLENVDASDNKTYTPTTYTFGADKFYDISDYSKEVSADANNRISGKVIIHDYWTKSYILESAKYMTDTNWLRLRSLSLSYTFPKNLLTKTKFIKGLSASITGNNLLLWTNYKGMDPETSAAGTGAVGSSSIGIDYCGVPATAGMSFGVNVTF
ncbi:TonB-dependent receptor SusC [termite gut metagenome]|uniref:TonB-dependent receptor SusC n=2 Tax=termite gut metagenome TaxID=433724 RepID=A0A5J4RBZ3_9ZZZZ